MITSNGNYEILEWYGNGTMMVFVKNETLESFKTLVQRAMNTWPDAPAELKEFADLLLEGKILQDYKSQV